MLLTSRPEIILLWTLFSCPCVHRMIAVFLLEMFSFLFSVTNWLNISDNEGKQVRFLLPIDTYCAQHKTTTNNEVWKVKESGVTAVCGWVRYRNAVVWCNRKYQTKWTTKAQTNQRPGLVWIPRREWEPAAYIDIVTPSQVPAYQSNDYSPTAATGSAERS